MNFIEALKAGFVNYANFSGRASRSEYWYWKLFFIILAIIELILVFACKNNAIFMTALLSFIAIQGLVLFIPGLSIIVRRLHDTDRRGWWILIILLPLVGPITFLVFVCLSGTRGRNRFGDNPLGNNDPGASPSNRQPPIQSGYIPAPNPLLTKNNDKTQW